ncbi:MAG TPA: hypothetical protein VIM71_01965 [Lacunisphaera sp.]
MSNHPPASFSPTTVQLRLDALRTELADLAYALERQGRVDAADVVMQIDTRVRELADEITPASTNSLCSL